MIVENVGTKTLVLDPQANTVHTWHDVTKNNLTNLIWLRTDNLEVGPQAFDFVQMAK